MKLVLAYPPFCTPTVPPHSIANLTGFVTANSGIEVACLDLNARFHRARFPELYRRLEKAGRAPNPYSEMLGKYASRAKLVHRANNVHMSGGGKPELFGMLLDAILDERPDVVGMSFVYNSQAFYGIKLMDALSERGVRCVAGGPAAGSAVRSKFRVLADGPALLEMLTGKAGHSDAYAPDYGRYPPGDYLSKEMVYPLRSSYGCGWRGCAFCTHHEGVPYREVPLDSIVAVVKANRMRNLFFIDDNIPAGRLAELASALAPLGVRWWAQTRPTADLLGSFPALRKGGLAVLTFGIESGSQRILDAMGKGTSVEDMGRVLEQSHAAGIRNIAFVMFGFPGETEESFMQTMDFLRANRESIDLVSSSIFGLQRGSPVYRHPEKFGVRDIRAHDTPLGEVIAYDVAEGLGEKDAKLMKERFAPELATFNRLPKVVGLLKEQALFF